MPGIVISEFQVAGGASNDEFVEITNTSRSAIDISGWRLIYRSAGGTTDFVSYTFPAGTIIPAGGHLLGCGNQWDGSVTPDFAMAASLAAAGGGIGLRDAGGTLIDSVGYGSATNAFVEGSAASTPAANNSMERRLDGSQDSGNNSADFVLRFPPTPQNAASPVQVFNTPMTGEVTITGTLAEDETLTADTSALADEDGVGTLHYQWQRDSGSGWVDVGADEATYTLGDADAGAIIRVVVSHTDGGGAPESVTSDATTPIANVNDDLTGGVTITGILAEDETLTADTSTLADGDGLGTLHYQWERNDGAGWVAVGADEATYVLGDADVGAAIRVVVGYADGFGALESVTSDPTTAITNVNDAPAGGVTITGILAEDETLTADTSTLADADGLGTLHYQWQRDDGTGWVDVGADEATYVLGDADVGAVIRVLVTYTDGGGELEQVSDVTAGVIANVDDAAVPADDAIVVSADTAIGGDVFADNGSGVDSDAEGDGFTVTEVNGSAADVGTQITLPSGALLTLNADGTFDYDPSVAFLYLPGPGSGAVSTATDSFTYTLAGGGTATVTITVNGVDGDGDMLNGTGGDDALAGGDGVDILIGSAGNDSLNGGDGIDQVVYSMASSGVTVGLNGGRASNDGDGGVDTLIGVEDVVGSDFNDLLIGSTENNNLRGGQGADILIGLDGNDTLEGGGGAANQMQGGRGDDLYFSFANDTLVEFLDEGYDTVFTLSNAYTLRANFEQLVFMGAGSFRGVGNAEDNVITGQSGDDVLIGLAGDDVLDGGGGGVDTADYSAAWDWITVDLTTGMAVDDGYGGLDYFYSIENIVGSAWDDEIYGDGAANVFTGGDGDDLLAGGGGVDVLRGGAGWDVADYSRATNGVAVKLAAGAATSDGDGASDVLVGIEDVNGSDFDDSLFGDAGSNILDGGLGRDVLLGGAGDDILIGGDGVANQLQGGAGDDLYVITANDTAVEMAGEGHDAVETTLNRYTLRANFEDLAFFGVGDFVGVGNALDNIIVGGDGNDTLTGGLGDDILVGTLSCGCGGGGTDTVVLAGVLADYLIEDLGDGAWGVTDSVAGRDGMDLLVDIDRIRFADGFVLELGGENAPMLSAKELDQPQVLPEVFDKAAALSVHTPLLSLEALLTIGQDGAVSLHHADGWLFG